jgi:hypothetical protein
MRSAFAASWMVDHLLGTRNREPLRKFRTHLHARLIRPTGEPNRFVRVPEVRVGYLDETALRDLSRGGPVLFKGLARGVPAIREWTFASLIERYGDLKQVAWASGAAYYDKAILKVREILQAIAEDRGTHVILGGGKWDFFHADPRMREELSLASWSDEGFLEKSAYWQQRVFVSGKGHWTPIHMEMGHNLSIQVHGSRRWTIFEPAAAPYFLPEITRSLLIHSDVYANARRLRGEAFGLNGWECEMEEGDVLFCPLYHWHFVETMRASVSAATKWATLGSLARHPLISAIFATSRNPNVLSYLAKLDDKNEFGPMDDLIPSRLRI